MACYGRNRRKAGKSCKKKVNKNSRKRVSTKPKKIRPNKTKSSVRTKKPKRQTTYKEVEFQPKPTKRKRKITLAESNKLEQKSSVKSNKVDVVEKEIVTENVTPMINMGGGYVKYDGKLFQQNALRELKPDLFALKVDGANDTSTSFGSTFPRMASKGDIFVRVDVMPNRVFKFDGNKWLEVQKESSQTYMYDTNYVNYLVTKIGNGEYDLELLNEQEQEIIREYLKSQNT